MSLFRNVISKLGDQVQQTAETVGQTVGQTVGKRVTQSLDAAMSSRLGHVVGEAWQKTLAGVTPTLSSELPAWNAKDFEKQIRNRLKPHLSQHPFYRKLQAGQLNQTQLHVWLANEWYCQQNLPLKDAAILSNCEDAQFRRVWTRRLLEQDGGENGQGVVELWARLATSLGLEHQALLDMTLVTPGVRFAMDAYVNFARRAPWTEAVCASLGELLNADHLRTLFEALSSFYGKPDASAVNDLAERASAQRREWQAAIAAVTEYFKSREEQEYALDILQFRQDILLTCLDSVSLSPLAQNPGDAQADLPAVKGEAPQRTRRKKATEAAKGKTGKAKTTVRSASAESATDKSAGNKAKRQKAAADDESGGAPHPAAAAETGSDN